MHKQCHGEVFVSPGNFQSKRLERLFNKFLLEKLLCGTGVVTGDFLLKQTALRNRSAVLGVPAVRAVRPRKCSGERRTEVVERPTDDRVIVTAHVKIDEADRITDT